MYACAASGTYPIIAASSCMHMQCNDNYGSGEEQL
jgi:hypothetical protein